MESEEITEIGTGFVQNSFRLGFPAIVISAGIIESTIQTAMQISATERALRLPPHEEILRDVVLTFMANIHDATIKVIP